MQTISATAATIKPRLVNSDGTARQTETFREGEEVVLASGTHQGTLGVFLHLTTDVNWAEIRERNGDIRSHPLVWLAHSNSATPGFANVPGERH